MPVKSIDEIQEVKNDIEFVIQEITDITEQQIEKLKVYNNYLGLTLNDILFDLRKTIFIDICEQTYKSHEDLAAVAAQNEEWNMPDVDLIEKIE